MSYKMNNNQKSNNANSGNANSYKRNSRVPFSVKNVLSAAKGFMSRCSDNEWKENFESFKGSVRRSWNHIFVQEHPGQKMVQITYMHPMITKNIPRSELLAITEPYPVHSMTIHIPSGELVYCFGPKSYVYSAHESKQFVEDTLPFAEENQEAAFDLVPHSFMFAARWFKGNWVLGGQSIMVANDVKFGSDATLFEEFVRLYGQEAIDCLDKSVIHVFRLCSNKYMPIDCAEGIWLLETRSPETGAVLTQHNYCEKRSYNNAEFKELLTSLAAKVQDQAVAERYDHENVLSVSLILSMGPYLVQIDSGIQRITEECVQQKKYMRSFLQESKDPLAEAVRTISARKAEEEANRIAEEEAQRLLTEQARLEEEAKRIANEEAQRLLAEQAVEQRADETVQEPVIPGTEQEQTFEVIESA